MSKAFNEWWQDHDDNSGGLLLARAAWNESRRVALEEAKKMLANSYVLPTHEGLAILREPIIARIESLAMEGK